MGFYQHSEDIFGKLGQFGWIQVSTKTDCVREGEDDRDFS